MDIRTINIRICLLAICTLFVNGCVTKKIIETVCTCDSDFEKVRKEVTDDDPFENEGLWKDKEKQLGLFKEHSIYNPEPGLDTELKRREELLHLQEIKEKKKKKTIAKANSPEQNLKDFEQHFQMSTAGRQEGRHLIKLQDAPVYQKPSKEAKVVNYLAKGDEIHVIAKKGEWLKIGFRKYVQKEFVKSMGRTTRGLK